MSSKLRASLALVLLLCASRAHAAIAFDNSASCGTGTISVTCSSFIVAATNPAIVVGFTVAGGDLTTGCTFNGVSMSLIDKQLAPTGTAYRYLYLLTANSGTHDVVCSAVSGAVYADVESYTGVNQSNTPDSSNKGGAIGGVTVAVTVVAANCWLVAAGENDGSATVTWTAGVTTRQINSSYAGIVVADSGGTVSAGSNNITINNVGAVYLVAASLAPASAAPSGCNGGLLLLGAGGCH